MTWLDRIPLAGKVAGGLVAIAGAWVALGFPYPAFRPAYDSFVAEHVSKVEKKVATVETKADRNGWDALENRLATLDLHYSLSTGQLNDIKTDQAFPRSQALKAQAAEIEGRLRALQEQHKAVQDRLRAERGY